MVLLISHRKQVPNGLHQHEAAQMRYVKRTSAGSGTTMGLGGSSAVGLLVFFGGEGKAVVVSCFRAICGLLSLLKSLRLARSRIPEGPATEAIWALLSMTGDVAEVPQAVRCRYPWPRYDSMGGYGHAEGTQISSC